MGVGVGWGGGSKVCAQKGSSSGENYSRTNSGRVVMQPTAELQVGSSNPGRPAVVCGAVAPSSADGDSNSRSKNPQRDALLFNRFLF